MMAGSDREILESLYARWNAEEPDLALDLFDADVDIHQSPTSWTRRGPFAATKG